MSSSWITGGPEARTGVRTEKGRVHRTGDGETYLVTLPACLWRLYKCMTASVLSH